MKVSIISKSLLPGLALLLATSAFGANKGNKGSIELDKSTTVSGHQLAPGQYKLTWDGTGSDVELMILSHGKLVATVPAHLLELSKPEPNDATELCTNDDGSQSLTKIDFGGKKYALTFSDESAMTGRHRRIAASKNPGAQPLDIRLRGRANNGRSHCLRARARRTHPERGRIHNKRGGQMPAAKLVVIYPVPMDLEQFERRYLEHHVPMAVDRLAGKTKIVATKVLSSAQGGSAPFHRIAEIHFPSMAALQACAASEGAKETIANAVSISTGGPPIFIVAEEDTFVF